MDIIRDKPKSKVKIIIGIVVAVALVGASALLANLEPASPTVERGTIYFDSVVRGEMIREVRGPGTLVPEDIRWITAVTAGRIEKIHHLAGVQVQAGTVLLELTNPDVQIQTLNADRQLTDAQAQLVTLKTNLENNRLNQASVVAQMRQEAADARRRAEAGAELLKKNLIVPLDQQQAHDRSESLIERLKLEEQRLVILSNTIADQIKVQEQQVERLQSIAQFQHGLAASMVVKAGASGILQEVPLQVGQYALPGTTLAKVVPTPIRLKAVLRIPETQAKDLALGQKAMIDTRNGVAPGRIIRIDPASINGTVTVDVILDGPPPDGSRPDLSVDGVIELERLDNVLHVGRPTIAQQNSPGTVFKLVDGGNYAERVQVKFGRTSVSRVEIVEGLNPGDIIIMSDMSQWDDVDRVKIK
ncbi:MAG: HlyD family efflux transporter periplasmic adaptor subunit [Gemmatimonadales bacterium]|nr:HlyD family efflux transporter periplasmic adaptor subunit [Gemmatimonadales bacterium]